MKKKYEKLTEHFRNDKTMDSLVETTMGELGRLAELKKYVVGEAGGPTDVDSGLIVSHVKENDEKNDPTADFTYFAQGGMYFEKYHFNLNENSKPGESPASAILPALNSYYERLGRVPALVQNYGDAVSAKTNSEEEAREFLAYRNNFPNMSMPDIYATRPEASKWITEALSMCSMDWIGRVVIVSVAYKYVDTGSKPQLKFEEPVQHFRGFVTDFTKEQVSGQRVIHQIGTFYKRVLRNPDPTSTKLLGMLYSSVWE